MQDLTISFIQTSIHWENKVANLNHFEKLIDGIHLPTDLIVLPEMCTTGFSMSPAGLADTMDGITINRLQKKAKLVNTTIIGSFIITEHNQYFNRALIISPDGKIQTYDKRHLFSYAGEDKVYTAGQKNITIPLKGWKIRPQICYDLRFPVWARNKYTLDHGWDYDVLLYVASWPEARATPWHILPLARAIENQAYVCTLNRIGIDGNGLKYHGDSQLINSYGEVLMSLPDEERIETMTLSRASLDKHRVDFQVGRDADRFEIK